MLKKLIILLSAFAIESNINCAAAQNAIGINYITKVSDEDLAQIQPDDRCAICQDIFGDIINLYKSNCPQRLTRNPHIFHRDCILRSINSGMANALNCPLCRGKMINSNTNLIDALADHNVQNNLIDASIHGHLEIVRLLLDRGADINARANDGYTSLIIASIRGNLEIIRLLLDRDVDINARTNVGNTALIIASIRGHLEIVRLLLNRGADINARTNSGNTALIKASAYGHLEIVRLLLNRDADINARTNSGNTALMKASRCGHLEIVRLLLDRDADINARDRHGDTALINARQNGHLRIAYLLIEHQLVWHRVAECTIS